MNVILFLKRKSYFCPLSQFLHLKGNKIPWHHYEVHDLVNKVMSTVQYCCWFEVKVPSPNIHCMMLFKTKMLALCQTSIVIIYNTVTSPKPNAIKTLYAYYYTLWITQITCLLPRLLAFLQNSMISLAWKMKMKFHGFSRPHNPAMLKEKIYNAFM